MSENVTALRQPALPVNHHGDGRIASGLHGWVYVGSLLVGRSRVAALARQAARLQAGDRVVDIGCGPGTAARAAGRAGATVIGVDPAAEMVRVGRRLSRSARVTYRDGSAEELPIEDGWATVVWSLSSVHHWRDVHRGIEEARRVLATGGRLVAIERCTSENARGHARHGWTEQQVQAFAELCRGAGFTDVAVTRHSMRRRDVYVVRATRT